MPIEYVNSFSFLGVILDSKLSWKAHIENVAKKISKAVCILTKLKYYLPEHCLKTIYDSLVCSHLNFCLLCWGFQPKQLVKLQKKAVRNISSSKYNTHTQPIFKGLRLLNLEDMLQRNAYNFYYKLLHDNLPLYFSRTFTLIQQQDIHTHYTRTQNFRIPRIYHAFAENSIRHYLPKLLNKNVHCILAKATTHSMKGFSIYIKNYFLGKYQDSRQIANCYVCNSRS